MMFENGRLVSGHMRANVLLEIGGEHLETIGSGYLIAAAQVLRWSVYRSPTTEQQFVEVPRYGKEDIPISGRWLNLEDPVARAAIAAALEKRFAEKSSLGQWVDYGSKFRKLSKEKGNRMSEWRILYFLTKEPL